MHMTNRKQCAILEWAVGFFYYYLPIYLPFTITTRLLTYFEIVDQFLAPPKF